MADEQHAQNDQGTGTATGNTQAAPVRTFTQADLDRIAGEAREEGRKAAQRAAEEQKLKEMGEFKALYEQVKAELEVLKPYKAKAEDAAAVLKETVEAEIAQLPEDARALVPEYDDPRKTLAWINTNKPRLVRPVAPATDAGARGDSGVNVPRLTDQERQLARVAGLTDEQWAKYRQRGDALAARDDLPR